ncbi:tautomerase family protein [Methylobacterium sp. J-077]|uniref:tautomerase family protein n=1 Tax=Methylobacterium sp. J-077 TaxID=2836656 RepID=UPI001FBB84B1|nr:tautomerase family protein [Methylobacterium sp. J-077]MCJ2127147.1 tautomerase family protein [Methylobacterium sp. J-077]
MPTYAISTAKDLTAEQRAGIVASITAIHAVEATAPRYFVQIIFNRVEPGSIFIGGEPASPDHVWVRADIRAGRTREQKARMLRRIMAETSGILGISEQDVWVYISDIPALSVLEFGHVLPEPGEEEQWLAALPSALREKLRQAA